MWLSRREMARPSRERRNKHSKKFISKYGLVEVGDAACFSCPDDKDLKNLRVTYDGEYGVFMINHAPVYYSVNEAMDEMLSEFK